MKLNLEDIVTFSTTCILDAWHLIDQRAAIPKKGTGRSAAPAKSAVTLCTHLMGATMDWLTYLQPRIQLRKMWNWEYLSESNYRHFFDTTVALFRFESRVSTHLWIGARSSSLSEILNHHYRFSKPGKCKTNRRRGAPLLIRRSVAAALLDIPALKTPLSLYSDWKFVTSHCWKAG